MQPLSVEAAQEPLQYEKGRLYDDVKMHINGKEFRITVYTNRFQRALNWLFGGFWTGGTVQIQSGLEGHQFIRIKKNSLLNLKKELQNEENEQNLSNLLNRSVGQLEANPGKTLRQVTEEIDLAVQSDHFDIR